MLTAPDPGLAPPGSDRVARSGGAGRLLLVAAVLSSAACGGAESAPTLVIDPARRQQTFEAWGTSLAWFGHAIGGWPREETKAELMDLLFDPDRGLGLNYVRYNIGGGENPDHEHFLREGGNIPGFQPAEGVWDWSADANQRWVLQEAIRRGAEHLEAFSNSPPFWMTRSGSVTGSRDGGNCLDDVRYDAFADYLTEVVARYRDVHGIVFQTLEPMNEPTSTWWTFGNDQEGCHFEREQQELILRKTGEALIAKGLNDTRLAAADETSIDETIASYESYGPEVRGLIRRINTHSYAGDQRGSLRALASTEGKELWTSEFGTGRGGPFGSALHLARTIVLDLNVMGVQGWAYWQAIENGNYENDWGLIRVPFSGVPRYELQDQYHAFAHFTRHIRPGDVILDVDRTDTLAALNPETGRIVIVAVNADAGARSETYALSAPFPSYDRASVYRTSSTVQYAPLPSVRVTEQTVSVSLPPESITTFVIESVGPR